MKIRKPSILLFAILAIILVLPASVHGAWFYLHDETAPGYTNVLLMDTSEPSKLTDSYRDVNVGAARWYTAPFSSDQKIYGDVSITLFIEAYFLRTDIIPLQFRVVRIFLLDVSSSGVEDEIASTMATPIFFISNETVKQKTFNIKNVDYTISAGHSMGLRVEKTVDVLSYFPFSVLSPFFSTNVLYDSTIHPSLVKVPFNTTQGGIELECYPQQQSVKPGNEVTYEIAVWNKGNEDETVVLSYDYSGDWHVELNPSTINVDANYLNYSDMKVAPPEDAEPGSFLNLTIYAKGITGTDSLWINTTVSEFVYGVDVSAEGGKEGKPGDTVTYSFTIRNTGDLRDSYNLSVISAWAASLDKQFITLEPGESGDVSASVEIPLDAENGSANTLTLTAQSRGSSKSDSASVTTKAIMAEGGGEGESFWSKISGKVMFALFVMGVIALLVIVILLTLYVKKYVILSCEEQMKEIPPGYSADYTITIKNPLEKIRGGKNRLNYRLAIGGDIPNKWKADINKEVITLEGEESAEVVLHVEAPEDAPLDEWASINVLAKPVKRRSKSEKINVATLLRKPKVKVELESVEHEPEVFKEGDKVISSIKIADTGEAPASNAQVILYVNGREKNRIEGLAVPVNGHVEVKMPWVAEPGENRITIKVLHE
ncbi:MAG: hypothetical protein U9O96_08465 [Candidatus Thermoplasmatota archaeon]|nr:hypothetical protein [Candidatus Thermoplasmatota archaeon]